MSWTRRSRLRSVDLGGEEVAVEERDAEPGEAVADLGRDLRPLGLEGTVMNSRIRVRARCAPGRAPRRRPDRGW